MAATPRRQKSPSRTAPAHKQRGLVILDALVARFPDARCELDHDPQDPWQLLVAVVLSAQSTDVGVNKVTPALFAAFPTAFAFARAAPAEIEPFIKSLGLYRNKAKAIAAAARVVVERYAGVVPRERAALEELPGVGEKSAAVIVANCFGVPAIAVDTHVGRVARRLGLTRHDNPSKVEADLTALWPEEQLLLAHHTLIFHGRRICHARKPDCASCPVQTVCDRIGVDEPVARQGRGASAGPASSKRAKSAGKGAS